MICSLITTENTEALASVLRRWPELDSASRTEDAETCGQGVQLWRVIWLKSANPNQVFLAAVDALDDQFPIGGKIQSLGIVFQSHDILRPEHAGRLRT